MLMFLTNNKPIMINKLPEENLRYTAVGFKYDKQMLIQ